MATKQLTRGYVLGRNHQTRCKPFQEAGRAFINPPTTEIARDLPGFTFSDGFAEGAL